jgi:hypothetical protein
MKFVMSIFMSYIMSDVCSKLTLTRLYPSKLIVKYFAIIRFQKYISTYKLYYFHTLNTGNKSNFQLFKIETYFSAVSN